MLPGDAKPGRAGTGNDRRAGNVSGIPVKPILTWMPPVCGTALALLTCLLSLPLWQRPRFWMALGCVCRGCSRWWMQRGGVRPVKGHRMGESCYWRARCSDCTECMELLDLDEKVHRQLATAIVASTATRSTPRWPHRPCIGYLRRQAPNSSAFPAWDRLLGMNGWGDLWGQGARACLASRCPVKSVRTIFTEIWDGCDGM
jgi:hypothetical protein